VQFLAGGFILNSILMKNYSEEGYKRMVEASARGRQKQRKAQIELSEKKKLEYLANPKLCPQCGTAIPYEKSKENTYCSQSCSASFNNKGVRRHGKSPEGSIECLSCGRPTKPGRKYCSQKCSGYRSKFDIAAWLRGEVSGGTVLGCSNAIKRWLLDKCGHKCPKCGWGEIHPVTGKVPLEVNHIDGDSTNNRPENLEVLCPNCHSLTPNYRALNKKSSRTHRSLRRDSSP